MSEISLDQSDGPKILHSAAQQESDIPLGWKPTLTKPLPAVRCSAIKKNGEQCKKWGVPGAGVCIKHGAQLPSVRRAAEARVAEARTRMMGVTPDMFDVLLDLTKPGVSEGVRLKAATEIMDRAGLKPGMEVNVTVENVSSPLEDIQKSIAELSSHFTDMGEVDIVDAEVDDQDSTDSPA